MWPIDAGGHPAPYQVGDRLGLRLAGCRAVDHRSHRGAADRTHDLGRLRDRVDELRVVARQRLNAIDHAGLRSRLGHRGKAIDAALTALFLFAGRERALIGRAMHQDARAELGSQRAQRAHDFDRAAALVRVGSW